jgi:hypothetical protein
VRPSDVYVGVQGGVALPLLQMCATGFAGKASVSRESASGIDVLRRGNVSHAAWSEYGFQPNHIVMNPVPGVLPARWLYPRLRWEQVQVRLWSVDAESTAISTHDAYCRRADSWHRAQPRGLG